MKERLTPSLIVRGLLAGNLPFFRASLAALCGIPTENAAALIHDAGALGLRSACKAAGLPPQLIEIVRLALELGPPSAPTAHPQRERYVGLVIAGFRDRMGRNVETLETLLALLDVADYWLPEPEREAAVG
jgi:uncharacterized protein (DUF2336 family)